MLRLTRDDAAHLQGVNSYLIAAKPARANWTTIRAPNWSLPIVQLGPSVLTVTASCGSSQDEEPGMSFHDGLMRTRQDGTAVAVILARVPAGRLEGRAR